MAYQTYITDALVLGSFDNNTADKSYALLTERAGLLYATARSVREERSKQRYALQDFSLITVTLIKGKRGWRVGSVEPHYNFFMSASSREARGSVVKLAKLIRRYVQGEEPLELLYLEVCAALEFLHHAAVTQRFAYELCATVRFLVHLGYAAPNTTIAPLCSCPLADLSDEVVASALTDLKMAYAAAQEVSHLER